MCPLSKGNVVTDTGPDSYFLGKQGRVSRIYPNGTVMVWFPAPCVPEFFFSYNEAPHSVVISYKGEDVKSLRVDEDWDPRNFPIVNHDNVDQVIEELLSLGFWPKGVSSDVCYSTQTDDSDGIPGNGVLSIMYSCDGDAHLAITGDGGCSHSVRFRNAFGGGHNEPARNAILVLTCALIMQSRKPEVEESE